jgi:hypothetical protein
MYIVVSEADAGYLPGHWSGIGLTILIGVGILMVMLGVWRTNVKARQRQSSRSRDISE